MDNDRINLTDKGGSCEVPRGSRNDCPRQQNPIIPRRHMESVGRNMYLGEYITAIRWSVGGSGNIERNYNYGF